MLMVCSHRARAGTFPLSCYHIDWDRIWAEPCFQSGAHKSGQADEVHCAMLLIHPQLRWSINAALKRGEGVAYLSSSLLPLTVGDLKLPSSPCFYGEVQVLFIIQE